MPTIVKVRKWGNSLGVRLPKSFTSQRDIVDGSTVAIDSLKIVPAATTRPRRRIPYKLKDLLKNYVKPPKEWTFGRSARRSFDQRQERVLSHLLSKGGDFIHFNASPSAGKETAGPHFALVMSPFSYSKKTGMTIVLIGTSKVKSSSNPRYGNVKMIPAGLISRRTHPIGEGSCCAIVFGRLIGGNGQRLWPVGLREISLRMLWIG